MPAILGRLSSGLRVQLEAWTNFSLLCCPMQVDKYQRFRYFRISSETEMAKGQNTAYGQYYPRHKLSELHYPSICSRFLVLRISGPETSALH
jgi:hypothetical protein